MSAEIKVIRQTKEEVYSSKEELEKAYAKHILRQDVRKRLPQIDNLVGPYKSKDYYFYIDRYFEGSV